MAASPWSEAATPTDTVMFVMSAPLGSSIVRAASTIRAATDAASSIDESGEQDAELLSAVAVDDVAVPDLVAEHRADPAEDLVTLQVAEHLVDGLEVVDVDDDHGRGSGRRCAGHEVVIEAATVGEAGETVAPGHGCQLVLFGATTQGVAQCGDAEREQRQLRRR